MVGVLELLPRTATLVGHHLPAEVDDLPLSFGIVGAIVRQTAYRAVTLDPVRAVAEAVLADLDDLTDADPHTPAAPPSLAEEALVRLATGVAVAEFACAIGDLEAAHEWIFRGLGGDGTATQQFELTAVEALTAVAYAGSPQAIELFATFALVVFHTSKTAGYLRELVEVLGERTARFVASRDAAHAPDVVLDAARAALAWARSAGHTELVPRLRAWCVTAAAHLEREGIEPAEAVALRLAAACSRDRGPQRAAEITTLVESVDQYGSELPADIRLDVLAVAGADDPERTRVLLPRLVDAVLACWAELEGDRAAEDVAAVRERALGVLGSPLTALAVDGDVDSFAMLIRAWMGETSPISPATIARVRVSLYGTEQVFAWPGGSCRVPTTVQPGDVAEAFNAGLGLALQGSDPAAPQITRPAAESRELSAGPALERVCRRLLALEKCRNFADSLATGALLIAVPGLPIPYQALIAEHGPTPGLWVSLREPAPDRVLRRVLLLEGSTHLSEVEGDLVRTTLANAGVAVEHLRGRAATTSAATAALSGQDHDLIWVTAHGRQPAYRPREAAIYLPGDQTLIEKDLRISPAEGSGRRLLVLNSCEAASTVQAGGLRRRGLAAAAASHHQAVIGHQWTVSEHFAAGFGVLLATALADGHGIDLAFDQALRHVRRPWSANEVYLAERGLHPDRIAELRGVRDHGDNILEWGAPALYC